MLRSTNGYLSGILAGGIGRPVAGARDRTGTHLRRMRALVLPDPVVGSVTSSAVTAHTTTRGYLRTAIAATVAALLLLVIGLAVFRVTYDDRVYPAVQLGDVPVGGLTLLDAQTRLTAHAAELERRTITFSYGGQTWTPTLAELGMAVDVDASLAEARQHGRTGNATTRLAFVGDLVGPDDIIPLQMRTDEATLTTWFDAVDGDIGRPPADARLVIEGATVTVEPGTTGIVVDREAATELLIDTDTTVERVSIELPTRSAPPALTADHLAPVQTQVTQLLSTPVSVAFEDQRWQIDGATISPFLAVELEHETAGTPTSHLTVDTDGLARVLRTEYSPRINRKPVDAVLGWDDGLVATEPSSTGAALRSNAFADAVAESFLGDHAPVTIPVVSIEPEIDDRDLDAYGITSLLGSGHSNFAGGTWERDENVRIGTEAINGSLVPPGGTFSFNGTVGAITYEKGYQEALVVSGEQIGRDVGGGICQVSTTVFRAALNSGMPITEWYPHTFRLPNYERDGWGPGFDASILQWGPNPDEWPDFKFENDTGHWLLVEAVVSDVNVYVNIYGSDDGRSVEINTWEIGGNAFGFAHVIYDAKGQVIGERSFESHFR